MRKEKLFCVTHRFKNIRMLLAAVLIIILLTVSGCAFIPETTEPTPWVPLSITAGNKTIQPYTSTRSALFWDEQNKGWLAADGIPSRDQLQNIADTVPVLTYASDLSLHYSENVTLYFISVFNDTLQELQIDTSSVEGTLHTLPEGTYYVCITVIHQGNYIAEGNDYETCSYDCIFKIIVT